MTEVRIFFPDSSGPRAEGVAALRTMTRPLQAVASRAAAFLRSPAANVLKAAVGIGACVAAWEIVRALGLIDPRDLPPFVDIVKSAAKELRGPLSSAVFASLLAWASGLLVAALCGVFVGISLATLPTLEVASRPLLEFLRPIPSVALIPIALLTLGIGSEMQLSMIVFACIWPIIFSVKAGVEAADPRHLDTARIFGLRGSAKVVRVIVPSVLPSLATGLRTAAAIALVLTITVEMLTGRPGIGRYLEEVRLNGLVTEMWAAIFVTGVLGYFVNTAMSLLERYLLPWSPENREH